MGERGQIENAILTWFIGADQHDLGLMTSRLANDVRYSINRPDGSQLGPLIGPDAVRTYLAEHMKLEPPGKNMRHLVSNLYFLNETDAEVEVNYYLTNVAVVDKRPVVVGHGEYRDRWVKESGRWLCSERVNTALS